MNSAPARSLSLPARRHRRFAATSARFTLALGVGLTGAAAGVLPLESASATTQVATSIASLSWGQRATVTGATSTVSGVASPLEGVRTVTLQRLDPATALWTDVQTFETDPDGRFSSSFDQRVAGTQTFRVFVSSTTSAYSVNSAQFAYTVAKRATTVTADLSSGSVTQNGVATISGTVGAGYANRVVQIHRRAAGSTTWTRLATSAPLVTDRYELKIPTTTVGSYDLRAYTVATDVAAAGTSAITDWKVTPRPRSLMAMDLSGIPEGPVTRGEFQKAFGLPAPLGSADNRQYDDTTVANGWLRTTFEGGRTHTVTLRHKMNTVGQNDGILQVWIDGNLMVDRHDYVYRTRSDVKVGHLLWHLFRGGNTAAWAGSRDGYVEISGLKVTTP